jgi:hypothetical protein
VARHIRAKGNPVLLDLLPVAVFLAVIAVGAVLIRCRLPASAAKATDEPECMGCGKPGRDLPADSFVCSGCGRDVREQGLARRRPRAFAGAFWRVVVFSAVLCVVALVGTGIIVSRLPQVTSISAESSVWPSGESFERMDFLANGQRTGDKGPLQGELEGDLFLRSGEVVTLEVQSPSLRYKVIDAAGRDAVPLSAASAFDESAVMRWLSAGGLDPADPLVRSRAWQTYLAVCETLRLPAPATPPDRPGLPSLSGGGSGGYSSSSLQPAFLMPAAVTIWSVLWLIGVWLILRRAVRRAAPTPLPEGAAA